MSDAEEPQPSSSAYQHKEGYTAVPTHEPGATSQPPPYTAQPQQRISQFEFEPERNERSCYSPCFEMVDSRQKLLIIGGVVAVIAVLLMILLPMSFAGLEYYEIGFKRRKSTGSVDTESVFGPGGRHAVGPDYEFKNFKADAHFIKFNAVTIFAADRLQVSISCNFQYFLRKDQLHLLHDNFDIHYEPILKNNALDSLKGAATKFTTREYIYDRERIEKALFKAARERLGGTCCEQNCDTTINGRVTACAPGCKAYSRCVEADWGLFAEVRYFQLTRLDIPDELNQRFLQALVLQEDTETEKLKQEAIIIRKETEGEGKQIENEATEIHQNATAQSNLIAARAEADASAMMERARSDGLKILYRDLGITDAKQRASFDYLRTLRGQSNVKLNIDFDQLIAGPLAP